MSGKIVGKSKNFIPEEDQIALRERLRFLRESQNLPYVRTPYGTVNGLRRWENVDISHMTLYNLYTIALHMGWTIAETLSYFASQEAAPMTVDKHELAMAALLKNMPESYRDTACALVEQLVTLAASENTPFPDAGVNAIAKRAVEAKQVTEVPVIPPYREPDVIFKGLGSVVIGKKEDRNSTNAHTSVH